MTSCCPGGQGPAARCRWSWWTPSAPLARHLPLRARPLQLRVPGGLACPGHRLGAGHGGTPSPSPAPAPTAAACSCRCACPSPPSPPPTPPPLPGRGAWCSLRWCYSRSEGPDVKESSPISPRHHGYQHLLKIKTSSKNF